jgi:DNA-binding Lrp family transcriptional regulator
MDQLDRSILTAIQDGLPAEERPFDALAGRLGIAAEEMLDRVRRLATAGVIRRLGPVFDSVRLGYVSTLVAARVPPERLAEVAARVGRLPGVTHNYERRHAYNLWFTLTCPSAEDLDETLAGLRSETGIREFHSLPALKVYKIRVHFDLAGETEPWEGASVSTAAAPAAMSEEQKELVRVLQEGIPAEREPFAAAAARLGWTAARVAGQVRRWLDEGVIRRFGAVVRHRELGFAANGMAVFGASEESVDAAGRRLGRHRQVSHCYRRPSLADFPYSLFAMVHGRSEEEVRAAVAAMAAEAGLSDYDVLFSVREFKKESMRYFPQPERP